jgi:ATP-dependent protease ClpP protease subunit
MADLNKTGRSHARDLISSGKVDKTSSWSFSAADGNALLGDGGNDWANYGKCHLGMDAAEPFDTKDHWLYPFAKGDKLYRSALIAIRQRAGQQSAKSIFDAAGALLDEIDGTSDRTHENRSARGPKGRSDTIRIHARPPRVEIQPRMDLGLGFVPPSADVLDRWQAGIRAAGTADDANIIQVYDVIGYDYWTGGGITAQTISDQLKSFNGADCEVHINSPGGDMFEGIAIYNLLQQYKGSVTVKVMALAASAASVIAMAGDDIEIGQGAFIMIHNCWVVAMGNRNDMLEVAAYLEPFDEALAGIYVARSGQKMADVQKWMDDETFFSADKAIALGFADETLDADELTEDKEAATQARAQNAVRKVESLLTKQGNMSRSKARALITELKTGKHDAAERSNSGTPGAAANATHDAGNDDWITSALALNRSLTS